MSTKPRDFFSDVGPFRKDGYFLDDIGVAHCGAKVLQRGGQSNPEPILVTGHHRGRAQAHRIKALLNLFSKLAQQCTERVAFPFTHHHQGVACFGQEIHHHRTGCFRNGRGSVIGNNARQCQ